MFITIEELSSAIYNYQLEQITEGNMDLVQMAIDAAIEEMKSYLSPNLQTQFRDGRKRYDVDAIFSSEGNDRNALVVELAKSIAVYYICRLANVDIIHEQVKQRYDRAIDWLEKVSGTGKYNNSAPINANLPTLTTNENNESSLPFRSGSMEKFNHEY